MNERSVHLLKELPARVSEEQFEHQQRPETEEEWQEEEEEEEEEEETLHEKLLPDVDTESDGNVVEESNISIDVTEEIKLFRRKACLSVAKRILLIFLLLVLLGSTVLAVFPGSNEEDLEQTSLIALNRARPFNDPLDPLVLERVEVSLVLQKGNPLDYVVISLEQNPACNPELDWVQLGPSARGNLSTDKQTSFSFVFSPSDLPQFNQSSCFSLFVRTSAIDYISVELTALQLGLIARFDVIYAAVILFGVYILITFELVHRTVAAAIGAFFALGAVSIVRSRPSLETVVSWVHQDTVLLLFGMMIIVEIFQDTGFFEWAAVKAFKLSKGRIRFLVLSLCVLTAILSMFLDNVTTMLLLGPVTIKLAEVLQLPPVPMLISEVLFSNLGGAATLIGDPPNIIIGGFLDIGFAPFLTNLGPAIVLTIPVACLYVARYYRKEFGLVVTKQVEELEHRYKIKDFPLLLQSSIIILVVMTLFFLEPILELEQAWVALLGATILTLVARAHNVEKVLEHVEWSTLLFFACLFVMLEGLSELGLVDFIGNSTASLIRSVDPQYRLIAALALVIWISALFSAFIDNIPYTVTMVAVIKTLSEQTALPIQPLAWALSFGACLGGNGTLIGASANVVTAGLAESAGYPFTFKTFFKVGFPFMLITVAMSTLWSIGIFGLAGINSL